MKDPIILKLKNPLDIGDNEKITQLEFSELKAKHLKGLKSPPGFDEVMTLIGLSTGQTPRIVDELSLVDFNAAQDVVNSFFFDGPATGRSA